MSDVFICSVDDLTSTLELQKVIPESSASLGRFPRKTLQSQEGTVTAGLPSTPWSSISFLLFLVQLLI